MMLPRNSPTDRIPVDLDPRATPAEKLRRPRAEWQRDVMLGVAAAIFGALGGRKARSEPSQKD